MDIKTKLLIIILKGEKAVKRKSKLINQKINGLLVLDSQHIKNDTILKVKCEKCGHEFLMGRKVLLRGISGCEKCGKQYRKQRNTKGYTHTKLYAIYMSILRRTQYCRNDKAHKHYFENQIVMCKDWQDNFVNFYEWAVNNNYHDGLSIDRIDNSKGYEPSNCRWVTLKAQANNRTNNKILEFNEKKQTLSQWSEELKVPSYVISNRLRLGWSIEDTLTKPYKRRKK